MRMLVLILVLLAPWNVARANELPEQVEILRDTVYAICDHVELTARWRDNPQVERTIPVPRSCATGFQVSDVEVLTAGHVPGSITAMLFDPVSGYFTNYIGIYQTHGYYTLRTIPVDALTVTFYTTLVSVEGQKLTTSAITFSIPWTQPEPSSLHELEDEIKATLEAELAALTTLREQPADAQLVARDPERDLALYRLRVPIERSVYPKVSARRHTIHTLSWGFGAIGPSRFREHALVQAMPGSIKDTGVQPNSRRWPLAEGVSTYRILTNGMNRRGMSGGPNINAAGELVGVTHAASRAEATYIGEFSPPCNAPMRGTGLVFTCERFVIAGHHVDEFLTETRE